MKRSPVNILDSLAKLERRLSKLYRELGNIFGPVLSIGGFWLAISKDESAHERIFASVRDTLRRKGGPKQLGIEPSTLDHLEKALDILEKKIEDKSHLNEVLKSVLAIETLKFQQVYIPMADVIRSHAPKWAMDFSIAATVHIKRIVEFFDLFTDDRDMVKKIKFLEEQVLPINW